MTQHSIYGISGSTVGGDVEIARMANGRSYTIRQEAWSVKSDYYLHTFVYHLSEIVDGLRADGNPLTRVLEMGIARGVLSIGVALVTDANTQIVGIDIEERARELVKLNAAANCVEKRIEVRIGDMFGPVQDGETFDMILAEMPFIPVAADHQQALLQKGHASEILNISGGPDGRHYIDALISDGSRYLAPGGSLVLIHPSFIGTDKTLALFAECGLSGQVLVHKEWKLNDTKFTRSQKAYIEATTGYTFPLNEQGEDVFYLNIVKGTKKELTDDTGIS